MACGHVVNFGMLSVISGSLVVIAGMWRADFRVRFLGVVACARCDSFYSVRSGVCWLVFGLCNKFRGTIVKRNWCCRGCLVCCEGNTV